MKIDASKFQDNSSGRLRASHRAENNWEKVEKLFLQLWTKAAYHKNDYIKEDWKELHSLLWKLRRPKKNYIVQNLDKTK